MAKRSKARRPSPLIADRLARFRKEMKRRKIGAYLISRRRDGYYLTGFTGEDSAILVLPRQVHVISDGRFDESINRECPWAVRWLRKGTLTDEIANVLTRFKLRSVAVQTDYMTVDDRDALAKAARSTRLRKVPTLIADMRCLKDKSDLAVIRKAIRIAEGAFVAMRASMRLGQTELELAARLEYEMQMRGASGPSFPSIVAEGANAALPHACPGKRRVKRGCAILFDWGARVDWYCSDLTRMLFIGTIPPRIREIYGVVLEAQQRAMAAIRPKMRMCDVDKVARDHITDAGFGDQFNHGLGHGLGLDVHEPPSLSWRSKLELEAGMVVTVEPGIYLPDVGGVRIEDDVLVTPTGHRMLSKISSTIDDAVVTKIR